MRIHALARFTIVGLFALYYKDILREHTEAYYIISGTNIIKAENSSQNKLNVWGECV